jgi:hypothetical protein
VLFRMTMLAFLAARRFHDHRQVVVNAIPRMLASKSNQTDLQIMSDMEQQISAVSVSMQRKTGLWTAY